MTKKILILSGSPRKQGNSDLLCDEFMRGALDAGHTVEKIRVQEKKVAYCTACYACRDTGNCAIKDDMADIMQEMIDCDVMVLASPVYFYSIDAQLKAVIDRSVCRRHMRWERMYRPKAVQISVFTLQSNKMINNRDWQCRERFKFCVNVKN